VTSSLNTTLKEGLPYPRGATWDGQGVNFALFSANATKVEVCLFDRDGKTELERVALPEYTDGIFHGWIGGIGPGQLYGYRVHGPYDPKNGHRFNPNKVLLDPYAKAIGRYVRWDDSLFAYRMGQDDLSFDERDSAPFAPLGSVIDTAFTWGDDRAPRTPWHKTLIYECHVKGVTHNNPNVPEDKRGTYAGIGSEGFISHLKSLNVTAVELLPVHAHLDDRELIDRGLTNYWGYNTLNFFSPHVEYASKNSPRKSVQEFKTMVRSLHAAGIEVILDVVYNHTCEGNHMGPTLSWKGVDNFNYYRLVENDKRYYMDYTGCGNTPNMVMPRVLQMVMDSLRYWVTEMHVDGFRFDLASTLARELHAVNKLGAFFDIIHQDPILSQVKLIAEPWDVGEGGYQVGNFPVLWTEWNGKYRDEVRGFWKGDSGLIDEMATRLSGSSDLYEHSGRKPYASINFITAHDGFTLQDVVSYNEKHNDANGESNRDGSNDNLSWNCGAEGPSDDPEIVKLRERQKRNLMATMIFSQGVAMIYGGDELSHTKGGNNNTYCQDNQITWANWDLDGRKAAFLDFVRQCTTIWSEQPVLQRRNFFQGRAIRGSNIKDITFFSPAGVEMTEQQWTDGNARCMGMRLAGDLIDDVNERGEPIKGDTLLILINAHWEELPFTLPDTLGGDVWQTLVDTAEPDRDTGVRVRPSRETFPLYGRSLAVLRTVRPNEKDQPWTSTQIEQIRKTVRHTAAMGNEEPRVR
jgi:isoamylase